MDFVSDGNYGLRIERCDECHGERRAMRLPEVYDEARAPQEAPVKRAILLALIRTAGYHGDAATFTRLYCENRISKLAADNAFRDGARARAAGVKCECRDCERQWNIRYVAYAFAHGKTPDAMLVADALAWPGGKMAGFIIWMSQRWAEWDKDHGHGRGHVRSDSEYDAFDAWLITWKPKTNPGGNS